MLTEATADDFPRRGTNPFGGDVSGTTACVEPGTTAFKNQIDPLTGGIEAGCIPFTNVRVTGGTGELTWHDAQVGFPIVMEQFWSLRNHATRLS